jgi:hypothetical protein
MTAPIGSGGGAAQSSVEQASPHRGSGLGPAHGGGKALSRALAIGGGTRGVSAQRSLGETGEGWGRERWRRWPVRGNGGEDSAEGLPTSDDGGGGSDQPGRDGRVFKDARRRRFGRRVASMCQTTSDRRARAEVRRLTGGTQRPNSFLV